MRIDLAWVLFDTKRSVWLADTADQSWVSRFEDARLHKTFDEARWSAYLASADIDPSLLQLQQVQAVWTVKSREQYTPLK